jgi:excinuclease ABC subunit C
LPESAGVYWWLDEKNNVLYVGKAKNLKHRLNSYRKISELSPRIKDMVETAKFLRWQTLDSELEALLVEAELINTYQPPYNILLKDDKSPLYIIITKEKWPRILRVRKRDAMKRKLAGRIFGPFSSSYKVNEVLKLARKIFPWCNAKRDKKMKRCFYNHLGQCPGVCTDGVSQTEYEEILDNLTLFLRGQKKQVLRALKAQLKQAAQEEKYELAALLREQIAAIEEVTSQSTKLKADLFLPALLEHKNQDALIKLGKLLHDHLSLPSNIKIKRIEGFDVSNTSGLNAVVSMVVFTNGNMDKSEYRYFNVKTLDTPNDFGMMKEVLGRRGRHPDWPQPDLILIDGGKGQVRMALKALKDTPLTSTLVIGLEKKPDRLVLPTKVDDKINWEIIKLSEDSSVLQLLQQVRDEAHRFSKSRHLKRREKDLFD